MENQITNQKTDKGTNINTISGDNVVLTGLVIESSTINKLVSKNQKVLKYTISQDGIMLD